MNILPSEYIADLHAALAQVDITAVHQAAARLDQARRNGRMIFVIGNGGSAATASHFTNDLGKLASANKFPAFRAMALADNVSLLTAFANDIGVESIFINPLANLAHQGDILVSISTSGASENLIAAMNWAHHSMLTVIAIVGTPESRCAQLADIAILTSAPRQTQQEDVALAVCHMIAEALR